MLDLENQSLETIFPTTELDGVFSTALH